MDPRKPTQEEIEAALALFKKVKEQRAKQRDRMKNDPAAKKKMQERSLRMRLKSQILLRKAQAAGITVSDKEIEAAIPKGK